MYVIEIEKLSCRVQSSDYYQSIDKQFMCILVYSSIITHDFIISLKFHNNQFDVRHIYV